MLSDEQRGCVHPGTQTIQTVTGERAPVQGKGNFSIQVGSLTSQHPMWVANLQDECILGLDFLERNRCIVDLADGTLCCNGEELPLQKSIGCSRPKTFRAVLDAAVTIAPFSEGMASARVEGLTNSSDERWGLLEPASDQGLSRPLGGLLIGKTLVDLGQPVAVVRLLNLSCKLHRGTEVATCQLVESVQLPASLPGGGEAEVAELPQHLREMYQRSTANLTPDECHHVHGLLIQFSHLFSSGPDDLGRTDVVKHRIETQGAAPLRQPPRRLPVVMRDEARKAVADMHSKGLIEPSCSPGLRRSSWSGRKMVVLGFAWTTGRSTE